uniref:Integrase core domain containing protein n=1 Tax=Solanum tuberosum TaxID=4113 RepID=M1B7H8_SOLTU
MVRKPLGKHSFFNQETNISGPEGTRPEATEEDTGEEIAYSPPFQGRWKEGNKKTTLEAYEFTPASKGPTDPFPNQSSQKGKAAMGDNNEETSLTDVVVAQPTLADQNEPILQLMQQIAKMRVEMQRKHDLPPPIFAINVQPDGKPPAQIPPPNMEQA